MCVGVAFSFTQEEKETWVNYSKNGICFSKKNYVSKVTLRAIFQIFQIMVPVNPALYTKIAHPTVKSSSGRK